MGESHGIKHGTGDDFWLLRLRREREEEISHGRIGADGEVIIKYEPQGCKSRMYIVHL